MKKNDIISYTQDFISLLFQNLDSKLVRSIVLFGSASRGDFDQESDIDLFIDLFDESKKKSVEKKVEEVKFDFECIKEKKWKNSFKDFLKVFVDISLGILLIFIFSKNFSLLLIGGLVAALPDAFTLLGLITPNKLLMAHENFHREIHFPEGKKISPIWGILTQLLVVIAAIYLLR